jgi:hypothetical protein
MQTLTVTNGTLMIEAGTTACFGAGVQLLIADSARLEVHGTAAAPVVLTATDPAQPWGGIRGRRNEFAGARGGHASLLHARLEYAEVGVAVHSFTLDSIVIRQIRGPAIRTSMIVVATGGYFAPGNGRVTGSLWTPPARCAVVAGPQSMSRPPAS